MTIDHHLSQRLCSVRAKLGYVILAVMALVASTGSASAHQPWFNLDGSPDPDRPFPLQSEIQVSQVTFGQLDGPGRVDYYAFTAPADFALDLHLVVPDAVRCAAFRPAFTLTGPGLKVSPERASATVATPASVPTTGPGSGTTTITGTEWTPLAHAGIAYLVGPAFHERLAGGDYLVAVHDPSGATGSYGLSLGGTEEFSMPPSAFAKNMTRWVACESGSPA